MWNIVLGEIMFLQFTQPEFNYLHWCNNEVTFNIQENCTLQEVNFFVIDQVPAQYARYMYLYTAQLVGLEMFVCIAEVYLCERF